MSGHILQLHREAANHTQARQCRSIEGYYRGFRHCCRLAKDPPNLSIDLKRWIFTLAPRLKADKHYAAV